MTAARTGNVPTLKLLLAYGADSNAKESTQGQTALMWTATENHAAAARTLIEAGADVNARSIELNLPPFKWVWAAWFRPAYPRRRLDGLDVRGARKRDGNCPACWQMPAPT